LSIPVNRIQPNDWRVLGYKWLVRDDYFTFP
jgi:hypothetical protein